MSRQSLPSPNLDPYSYAVHALAMGMAPTEVEARVAQLFPGIGPVGASATTAQAEAARASASSFGSVLAGQTPAYQQPPSIPGVPAGATQVDVRFDIQDPRTGRTRTIIVRDTVTGTLTAGSVRQIADEWVRQYAAQYGLHAVPVPLGLTVTAVAQGPQA